MYPTFCFIPCKTVYVQNTSFCQSAGGGITSHLVTALVCPSTYCDSRKVGLSVLLSFERVISKPG